MNYLCFIASPIYCMYMQMYVESMPNHFEIGNRKKFRRSDACMHVNMHASA